MKSKALLLLLFLCVCFSGCRPSSANVGSKATVPLDRILEALQNNTVAVYESAFPPTFCEQYRDLYPDLEETVEHLLTAANAFNRENHGEDVTLRYELTDSESYDHTQFEEFYPSTAIDSFAYSMPITEITEARQITVTVYIKGSYLQAEQDLTYLVLFIGGNWYLHPQHFGTVLRT